MSGQKKRWTMPRWMRAYVKDFTNTGFSGSEKDCAGKRHREFIEELMNDRSTTAANNFIRASMIVSTSSQVHLLARLFEQGKIR